MEDITTIGYESFIAHTDSDKEDENLYEHMESTLFELNILMKDTNYIDGIIYLLKNHNYIKGEKISDESINHIIRLFYLAVEYHDMGKTGSSFQKMVGNNKNNCFIKNDYPTDHSMEGALIYLMEGYNYIRSSSITNGQLIYVESMIYILAELIACHHTELVNMTKFKERIKLVKERNKDFTLNFSNYIRINSLSRAIEDDYFIKKLDKLTGIDSIYDINTYLLKYIWNFLLIKSDNLATSKFSNSRRLVKNDVAPVNLQREDIFNKDMWAIKKGNIVKMNGNLLLSNGNKSIIDGEYYNLSDDLVEKYSYKKEIVIEKPYVEKYLEKNLLLSPLIIMNTTEIISMLFGRSKWDIVKRHNLYQANICLPNIFKDMDYRDKSKILKIMCELSKIMMITFILPEGTTFPENKVTESDISYFKNSGNKVLDNLYKDTYYIIPSENKTIILDNIINRYSDLINYKYTKLNNTTLNKSERYAYRQLLLSNTEYLLYKYSNKKVFYSKRELNYHLDTTGNINIGKFIIDNTKD